MDSPKDVTLYLEPPLIRAAQAGRHNFLSLVTEVLTDAGLTVHYDRNGPAAAALAEARPGYALFHMTAAPHARGLTFRRCYTYPFWQIAASAKRWEWPVARATFNPDHVDADQAARFLAFWQRRLFKSISGPGDEIYVPLQGRIRKRRSFQAMAPVDMVAEVARRFPDAPVSVTLHPNETYEAADHAALRALGDAYPKLTVTTGGMETRLRSCRMIVSQTSAAAFMGYFFARPVVLFGRTEFHHIAGDVLRDGLEAAFAPRDPDHAAYLWWFLQDQAINAGRAEAKAKIAARLRSHGWPV